MPKKPAEPIPYQDLLYKYGLLQQLMDLAPDVIYFKDRQGKFLLVNQAHAKGLRLKPEQVVGKTDFDIHPKERAALMAKDDEYVMSHGKPIIDKVERSTRADGIDNYVSTTKIPRYDDKGNCIGLVGITRDITHRMQLENVRVERDKFKKQLRALEEINRVKSEFISIVSHELKTPLAIAKEGISIILDGIKGPVSDEQRRVLESAYGNTERLKKIIEELLDISRIEKGKMKLQYSLADLNCLIRELVEYYKKVAQDKGIEFACDVPQVEANIFIDPERTAQIISNLLDNAFKFTEEGGRIEVELKIIGDEARVGVIDAGVGITKQHLEKIFERFMQVDDAAKGKNKGVGLGLSIIKELVNLHGGQIWAESRPGIGSKFYFTLPRFYTSHTLDKELRNRINGLLDGGLALHLVNLLIMNFKELTKTREALKDSLSGGLNNVVGEVLKSSFSQGEEKQQVLTTPFQEEECRIVCPDTDDKTMDNFCLRLKNAISGYFKENKLENIFVNTRVSGFPKEKARPEPAVQAENVFMRRVHIGLERRRFERFAYSAPIDLSFPADGTGAGQTIDISEGGLCILAKNKLRTDSRMTLRMSLPTQKHPLSLTGRVVRIREIEEPGAKEIKSYKGGIEFLNLNKEDKAVISEFIRSMKIKDK